MRRGRRAKRKGRRAASNQAPLRVGDLVYYSRHKGKVHTVELIRGRWWVGIRGGTARTGTWSVSTYYEDKRTKTPNFTKAKAA